jgi:hypothetical protein
LSPASIAFLRLLSGANATGAGDVPFVGGEPASDVKKN